jgi:hypothetical protein
MAHIHDMYHEIIPGEQVAAGYSPALNQSPEEQNLDSKENQVIFHDLFPVIQAFDNAMLAVESIDPRRGKLHRIF